MLLLVLALAPLACTQGEPRLDLEAHLASADFDSARGPAEALIQSNPGHASAWMLHAEAALGRQDPGMAERSLSRAAECAEFDTLHAWRARFLRGQIEAFRGRFAAAEGSLTGALPSVWDRAVRAGRASIGHWRACLSKRPHAVTQPDVERAARNLERSLRLLAFWEAERARAQAAAQQAEREAGKGPQEVLDDLQTQESPAPPPPSDNRPPSADDFSEAELNALLERLQRSLEQRRQQRRNAQRPATGSGGIDW